MHTPDIMYLQIAFVLAEFDLVHELNVGIKRIYASMNEQNLASQIYTGTKKSITLILNNTLMNALKNSIKQRKKLTKILTKLTKILTKIPTKLTKK